MTAHVAQIDRVMDRRLQWTRCVLTVIEKRRSPEKGPVGVRQNTNKLKRFQSSLPCNLLILKKGCISSSVRLSVKARLHIMGTRHNGNVGPTLARSGDLQRLGR